MGLYETFAGQKINFSKSELCGSKNVDEMMLRLSGDYLNMKVVSCHSKYLGLPMVVGQNKKDVFGEVDEKVQRKIQSWSPLLLSIAGCETLIKVVVQAIPLYSMNCFGLPKTLCNKLSTSSIQFWWS